MTAQSILQHPAFAVPTEKQERAILLQQDTMLIDVTPDQNLIRIISGCAWISHDGKDIVLRGGEEVTLRPSRVSTMIAVLGRRPLVIEMLSAK